jgi:GNAT superfamily N-acetyltransferase
VLDLRPVSEADLPASRERLLERAVSRRVRTSYEEPAGARETASRVLERNSDHLRFYDVLDDRSEDDERPIGWLAWWHKDDQCEVNDVVLDDPDRGAELLPALLALGRVDGCPAVAVAVVPGEPEREALAGHDGFVRRATNMALPLDGPIGDPGDLRLDPMTEAEFAHFLADSTEEYIGELRASGMSEASARRRGEEQMAELIPHGLATQDQNFFTARVGGSAVGTLWLSTERPLAFVYDVAVEESQRRRGYGAAIMDAGARWCRDRGHPALGLNVFAHNPGARALYDKLGYHVTRDFGTYDVDGS